ncbi:MAG: 50S ribosomal protein L29 [Myxococcota bacterium]
MKPAEIRELNDEELQNLETDLARKLWKARFDNHTNALDDTSDIKKIRKDIARVKTLLTERANAAE